METRPGTATTEFWLVVLANAVGLLQLIADPFAVADKWVLLANGIVTAAYAISRGQAKQGIPADLAVDFDDQGRPPLEDRPVA